MAVTKIDQRAKETSGSIFNLVERIYEKISRIPASFAEALDKVLPEQQFQIQRSGAGACQSVLVQIECFAVCATFLHHVWHKPLFLQIWCGEKPWFIL